jgi:hypothetical protein
MVVRKATSRVKSATKNASKKYEIKYTLDSLLNQIRIETFSEIKKTFQKEISDEDILRAFWAGLFINKKIKENFIASLRVSLLQGRGV